MKSARLLPPAHTYTQNSSEPLWKQSKRKAAADMEANPDPKAQLRYINSQIEAAQSSMDAQAIKKALKKLYKMTMTPELLTTTAKELGLIANMKARSAGLP